MKTMYGVITAMTTPFDENDCVDVQALNEQVEFLVAKGVDCLYPCGTTGEMFNMTPEERELVAETVVRKAAGRVMVYIHVGAMTLKETVRLANHARKIGADGIGVVTPGFFGIKDQAMIRYYQDVAASVPDDFPIYLYCIPQCAANDLKPSVVQKIADTCPNVVGIKYSYADCVRLKDYLLVRRPGGERFSVLFGPDRLFLPALVMGCDGTVSGCSGPMPEYYTAEYQAYTAGDLKTAQERQRLATKVCEVLENGTDMAVFKEALNLRGVKGGHMRRPLMDLAPEEICALRDRVTPYL